MKNKLLKNIGFMMIIALMLILLTACAKRSDRGIGEGGFGFFDIFVYPMAGLMWLVAKSIGFGNYALTIFFSTIIVRSLAWPIYAKTTDLSLKMQLAQPEIEKVNLKYQQQSNDPMARQKMSLELRQVYKKYGIGIGGCLLPLLQLPIFMGFFEALQRIPRSYHIGNWIGSAFKVHTIGAIDLFKTRTDGGFQLWGIIILAIIVGLTQIFITVLSQHVQKKLKKDTTSHLPEYRRPKQNEKQKAQGIMMNVMMYAMTGMMIWFVVTSPAGLGFYWVVGNIFTAYQQIISNATQERRKEKLKQKAQI